MSNLIGVKIVKHTKMSVKNIISPILTQTFRYATIVLKSDSDRPVGPVEP